jgi:hypothetical protein
MEFVFIISLNDKRTLLFIERPMELFRESISLLMTVMTLIYWEAGKSLEWETVAARYGRP